MSKSKLARAVVLSTVVMMIPMFVVASSCCGSGASPAKAAATAKSDETEVVQQTKCPVMGGKINKAQYADVNGKRIYVCCPGCISKIKADPAKYIKKLEDAGVTVADAPAPAGKHAGHKH